MSRPSHLIFRSGGTVQYPLAIYLLNLRNRKNMLYRMKNADAQYHDMMRCALALIQVSTSLTNDA